MSENEMNVQPLYSHPYYAKDGKLYIEKQSKSGPYLVQLCNFTPRIVSEVTFDDGQTVRKEYRIGGEDEYGNPLPEVDVAADELSKIAEKLPSLFAPAFKSASALCRVLEYKYALGIKTRKAYKARDKKELLRLAHEDYTMLLTLIPEYHKAFKEQWDAENRPSGFDLQDIRLGGLIQRTKSCRERLIDYAEGRLDKIDELEIELLEMLTPSYGKWRSGKYLFTPNVFEGI